MRGFLIGDWMAAMMAFIPYFEQPRFEFAGMEVQTWDIFVAVGFLSGVWLASRATRLLHLDSRVISDYAPWALLCGFSGGHLVHVFAYEPHLLAEDPLFILYIWSGLSSFGGFLGAAIALVIFFYRRKDSFWDYADSFALGMAPAWLIARIGCFFAHDHKGRLTDFFLAVDFPASVVTPAGPRHDLGLYDAILSLFITVLVYVGWRYRPRKGTLGGWTCVIYSVGRFFQDFLRATDLERSDARYLGLTPAQYGCFALLIFGLFMLWKSRSLPRPTVPTPEVDAPEPAS